MTPIPYDPRYEVAEEDEAETGEALLQTTLGISQKTHADTGQPLRSVHAKSHALLRAEVHVAADLPPMLAQGVFARPGVWPAVLRLSTVPGDLLDDSVSAARGLALKLIGVDGERLPGSEADRTQDFVMVNGETFLNAKGEDFLRGLKLLAATTDRAPAAKKAWSAVMRGAEKALEAVGGESAALKAFGGQPLTHPLGDSYFSQAPILYGPYMAKVCVAPVSPSLKALTGAELDIGGDADGLRHAVQDYFARQGAEWELRVQLCTNIETMPIENSAAVWPQAESPYLAVARIVAPPQAGWSAALSRAVDQGMSFNPWHGVAAHRPLGSIMRMRRAAYAASARFRAERAGVTMSEPDNLEDFPS